MIQYSREKTYMKYTLSSTEDYSDQCCDSSLSLFLCNGCIMQSYFKNSLFCHYISFRLFENESTNAAVTFCKILLSEKILIHNLYVKMPLSNQVTGHFDHQYIS